MSEPQEKVRLSAAGITIELDLSALLNEVDPQGKYIGYDPEADEDHYVQTTLHEEIVHAASLHLVKSLRKEVKDAVLVATRDAIKDEVEAIVRETLDGPVQKVSDWGSPTTEAVPLRDLIGAEAQKALKKPELRDGYSRSSQRTMVQEIIAKEVGTTFAKDLQGVVAEARKQALAAVQEQAANIIAESVRRATPGL